MYFYKENGRVYASEDYSKEESYRNQNQTIHHSQLVDAVPYAREEAIKYYKNLFNKWIELGFIIASGGIDMASALEQETYRIQYAEAKAYAKANYQDVSKCPNLLNIAKFVNISLTKLADDVIKKHESRVILSLSNLCIKRRLQKLIKDVDTLDQCLAYYKNTEWVDYGTNSKDAVQDAIRKRVPLPIKTDFHNVPIRDVEPDLTYKIDKAVEAKLDMVNNTVTDPIPEDSRETIYDTENGSVVERIYYAGGGSSESTRPMTDMEREKYATTTK